MKIWLGMLLLAVSAGAQSDAIPGLGPTPAAPHPAGRGRGAATAPGAGGGVGSPKDLKYPPLRAIQAPDSAVFTLPNGMKLYLHEDHDLPVVGGMALVRTGGLLDPPQRTGLAQVAGIAMRSGGTSLKTGEQIDTLLDNSASTIESSIGDSYGTVSFNGLKENAPATLQLFKEILTQPGFRPDKIEIAKTQLRVAVSHRNDSAGAIARREFVRLVYGKDSPYGRQVEYATLNRVSRGDVRAFHQRYFFPANVMLGVYGDFNSAEMKAAVEKLFADWTVRQEPAPEFEKVKNAPSPGVFLAEKKDATQTFFTMGHLGGQRDDKDYAALEILAGVLGGARSRIAERVRTTLDMTADWNADYAHAGLFEVSGSVNSLFTVETIKAIEEEIERLRTAEAAEDEWRKAREAAVDRLVFADETRARLFAHQMMLDYRGYPKDYLQRYQNALESVTRADLLRVAKQYLNPASLTVVVAANPTMFGGALEKLGPVTRLDVAIPEGKLEAAESSDASLAEGKHVLLLAQAAAGGAEKLAAVKDHTVLTEYAIDPAAAGAGGSKVVQTERWVAPSTLRQDATVALGRVSIYTDGKVGWLSNPQGSGGLTGAQRTRVLGDLFHVYYRLLLSDRLEGRTVNAIDDSTVQIADTTGQVANLEFDAVTHLAKRLSWDVRQDGGASIYHEEVYDDFRDAGGIKVPYKITVNEGGRKFADVVVKEYKINTGLNPLELARRTP
jgi:zinc protease